MGAVGERQRVGDNVRKARETGSWWGGRGGKNDRDTEVSESDFGVEKCQEQLPAKPL